MKLTRRGRVFHAVLMSPDLVRTGLVPINAHETNESDVIQDHGTMPTCRTNPANFVEPRFLG